MIAVRYLRSLPVTQAATGSGDAQAAKGMTATLLDGRRARAQASSHLELKHVRRARGLQHRRLDAFERLHPWRCVWLRCEMGCVLGSSGPRLAKGDKWRRQRYHTAIRYLPRSHTTHQYHTPIPPEGHPTKNVKGPGSIEGKEAAPTRLQLHESCLSLLK